MGSLGTITNSGAAGQEISSNIIPMSFKKSLPLPIGNKDNEDEVNQQSSRYLEEVLAIIFPFKNSFEIRSPKSIRMRLFRGKPAEGPNV
jgi:hypothetical protein